MSFEISSVGDFESFDYLCGGYFKEFLLPPMHPVPGSKSGLGDSRGNIYLCQQSRDQQDLCEAEIFKFYWGELFRAGTYCLQTGVGPFKNL